MPLPYVVYEAIYTPQPNAQYPQFTPADLRVRFGARAVHEFALVDHLKPQQVVACRSAAEPVTCLPQDVTADIVPFDPERAAPVAGPQIVGCAAIDSASQQDRLGRTRTEGSVISERFTFGQGSSSLSPDASDAARAVAKRMADDPTLECVGVVGQTTPGESLSLAEARARAVKQLLVSLGVDSRRLSTIAATASVYGPAAKTELAVDPANRRVSLSVLLQTATPSAP